MKCNEKCEKKKSGSLMCILGGMLAGAAVSAVGIFLLTNNTRTIQKKANKVADAMENLANSAADMFK